MAVRPAKTQINLGIRPVPHLQSPALLQGQSYGQSPAQLRAVGYEITWAGLGMESKAPPFHGTVGMMLRSKLIPGPVGYKWLVRNQQLQLL